MQKHPDAKVLLFVSGIMDIVIITDNQLIKTFYQEASNEKKVEDTFNTEPLFYDSLIQASGELWKNSRKFLNQFFHFKSISDMINPIKQSAKHYLEDELHLDEYQKIDLRQSLKHISSLSVQNSFFGYTGEILKCNNIPFHKELNDILSEIFPYSQKPFFMLKTFFFGSRRATHLFNTQQEKGYLKRIADLKKVGEDLIENRYNQLKELDINAFQPKTLIDIQLKQLIINEKTQDKSQIEEHNRIVTKQFILRQFFTFFLAGSDTSALTLTFLLYHLSIDQNIKRKVIEEITNTTSTSYDDITFDELNKLNYTTKVIKETLRLYPPIHFLLPRQLSKEINQDGLYLEKGMITTCRLVSSSKFENFYKFDPDRFDDVSKQDTFDYIPFSAGQRNCIGQHFGMLGIKIFLCYILKNFDIQPVENYELKIQLNAFMLPVDPYLIKIKRLKK